MSTRQLKTYGDLPVDTRVQWHACGCWLEKTAALYIQDGERVGYVYLLLTACEDRPEEECPVRGSQMECFGAPGPWTMVNVADWHPLPGDFDYLAAALSTEL